MTVSQGPGDGTRATPGASHAARGRAERIVLREVDPAQDAADTPVTPESSTVTTSLLEAFAERSGTAVGSSDDVAETRADSAAGSHTGPTTADTNDTPTEANTAPTTADTNDTPTEPNTAPTTADANDTPTEPAPTEPVTSRFANLPTVPFDGSDAHGAPATGHDDNRWTEDTSSPHGTAVTSASRDDSHADGQSSSTAEPWTTVAQVTLLCMGVLAAIQTVVLIIVTQFLTQSASGAGRDVADVLAAHSKVITVMLPAVVGGAVAAIALAVWQARIMSKDAPGAARSGRRVLGVPATLVGAAVATLAVLIVVLLGSSASVADAQRTTFGAIATCVALAVTFLLAPRSLAVPPAGDEAPVDDTPTTSPGPLVGVG